MASILDLNPDFRKKISGKMAQAQPSTTAVATPTQDQAEAGMFLQSRPFSNENMAIADIAGAPELNVKNMSPEEYKKLATVFSEINKKYGNPGIIRPDQTGISLPKKGRPFYVPFINKMVLPNQMDAYRTADSLVNNAISSEEPNSELTRYVRNHLKPTTYFQELAHSKQFYESPIASFLKGIKGLALMEDNHDPKVGRYAVPGELEYEAHSVIAPKIWNEFKALYEKKYGKFPERYDPEKSNPELLEYLKKWDNTNKKSMLENFKYNPKTQQKASTTMAALKQPKLAKQVDYVDDRILNRLRLGSVDPENPPKDKEKIYALQYALEQNGYNLKNSIIDDVYGKYNIYDGIYGPETKAALIDWQKKNK